MGKICSSCKKEKSFSEFCKNKSRPGGLHYSCKSCKNADWRRTQSCTLSREDKIKVRKEHFRGTRLCVIWESLYRTQWLDSTDLVYKTGLRRDHINTYLNRLLERGLVERKESGKQKISGRTIWAWRQTERTPK